MPLIIHFKDTREEFRIPFGQERLYLRAKHVEYIVATAAELNHIIHIFNGTLPIAIYNGRGNMRWHGSIAQTIVANL